MASFTPEDVAVATADLIRAALARGEDVHVPGLGTFTVDHRPSQVDERPDGEVVIRPPRDEISFHPSR